MEETKYNGWTNRETWLVNLWLDNDGYQGMILEQAISLLANPTPNPFSETGYSSPTYLLADWLKDIVEEIQSDSDISGMLSDLLGAALGRVNWEEIASHYIDIAKEETP